MIGLPPPLTRHSFVSLTCRKSSSVTASSPAGLRSEYIEFPLHTVYQHRNICYQLRPRDSPLYCFDMVSFSSKFAHISLIFAFDLRSFFSFFLLLTSSNLAHRNVLLASANQTILQTCFSLPLATFPILLQQQVAVEPRKATPTSRYVHCNYFQNKLRRDV